MSIRGTSTHMWRVESLLITGSPTAMQIQVNDQKYKNTSQS